MSQTWKEYYRAKRAWKKKFKRWRSNR